MKITKIDPKKEITIKHELGKVYRYDERDFLVVQDKADNLYRYLNLYTNTIDNMKYKSLEDMDNEFPNETLVDVELIIKE